MTCRRNIRAVHWQAACARSTPRPGTQRQRDAVLKAFAPPDRKTADSREGARQGTRHGEDDTEDGKK